MKSYLSHLECTYCHQTYDAGIPQRLCNACGKVLYSRYDIDNAKQNFSIGDLSGRAPNMWRYFEMLPVLNVANVVTLGEGFTPIFDALRLGGRLGYRVLNIKDEGLNPTASFKARGLSAAVSKASAVGLISFV